MFYLRADTRAVDGYTYPTSLANSIHFQYSFDGVHFAALNQNYGMLYAKAELSEQNTILERGLLCPEVYMKDGEYAILSEYVDVDGKVLYEGKGYLWKTMDFVSFEEVGLVQKDCVNDWMRIEKNTICLTDEMGREILDTWVPLTAKESFLPQGICVEKAEDLAAIKAQFMYSDGSVDEKSVDWNTSEIPVNDAGKWKAGRYHVKGTVKTPNLKYPLAVGYADPVLFQWEGSWYFLATNDILGNVGLFIRRAESEEALFDERALERCILFYNEADEFIQTFWAPEFHVIGGEAYILFAVGGKKWAPQSHMMKLKKGCDLLEPTSWEKPVRVCLKNGTPLTTEGISLDMTYLEAAGVHYVAWSYRFGIGSPADTGSMIYIATIDPEKPWQLTSDPVLLSRPLYGWENIQGTINNEGPYALKKDGKIYLAYSAGAACGYSYVVGYLTAEENTDLTDPSNWKKYPCPLLNYYSVGISGPGHNSFYISEEGKTMIAYHGQLHVRCSAIHRVHFNKKGFPLLNMSPERDVPEEMKNVGVDILIP